jgi:hypothetical protein
MASQQDNWPSECGYCSIEDVAMNNAYVESGYQDAASTYLTPGRVEQMIRQVSAMIDRALLRAGISLPLTEDGALETVKGWCAMGAAGRAAMATDQGMPIGEAGARSHGVYLWQQFLKWLNDDEQVSRLGPTHDLSFNIIDDGLGGTDPDTGDPKESWFRVRQVF